MLARAAREPWAELFDRLVALPAGNGGQIFMGIAELDLAIAFTGGNYADVATFIPQRVLVPEHILPAIR